MDRFMRFAIGVFIFMSLAVSAASQEQCPAIDCGCTSIPDQKWANACTEHETFIKNECANNSNTPKDYCLIHGLNAKPLPLAIKYLNVENADQLNVDILDGKISSLFFALRTDLGVAEENLIDKSYARTLQILKLIDSNIDKLFAEQQRVDEAYYVGNEEDRARSVWEDNADQTLAFANSLRAFGSRLADLMAVAETAKLRKIHSVLAQKSLRMAGKTFEHLGYANSRFGEHDEAAKSWMVGAEISLQLAAMSRSENPQNEGVRFSEYQAVARFHRAAYHWLIEGRREQSLDAIRASQPLVDSQYQQSLQILVNDGGDDESTDELSGR